MGEKFSLDFRFQFSGATARLLKFLAHTETGSSSSLGSLSFFDKISSQVVFQLRLAGAGLKLATRRVAGPNIKGIAGAADTAAAAAAGATVQCVRAVSERTQTDSLRAKARRRSIK